MNFSVLTSYIASALPGVFLGGLALALIPKKMLGLRIMLYAFMFVFIRDLMTPHGLWILSKENGLTFSSDVTILSLLGLITLVFTFAQFTYESHLKAKVVFFIGSKWKTLLFGFIGGFVVGIPALSFDNAIDHSYSLLAGLLFFSLCGNFLEEMIFRGFLQGYLEDFVSPLRAAMLSGLMFSLFHIHLSFVTTQLGYYIILFTLYEGILCSLLRMRYGLFSSILAHGIGIFIMASGLL